MRLAASRFDASRVSAIALDLDDTLWPFQPAVERAERALHAWLVQHAPKTAGVLVTPRVLAELRAATQRERPELAHDLSALRRESIRTALRRADEDPSLAEAAYAVFFAERQRVVLYDDVLPSLHWLSERYPLVAVSNGNGDLELAGVHGFFRSALSAAKFGRAKPDAAIFHAAAAAAGSPCDGMLHVGDDPVLDIAGALAAGLQAAWVVRSADAAEPAWESGGARPQLIVRSLRELCQALGSGSARPYRALA
ncbi:MAG: family hydrolase [Ramlibacter sp.]|nr:family hydrolase [Ramlibacter sp.]